MSFKDRAGVILFAAVGCFSIAHAQTDPGIRNGGGYAGDPIAGLSELQMNYFGIGSGAFSQRASVTGAVAGTRPGLGPRFNHTSCEGCHSFPAEGGSSPRSNPQLAVGSQQQVAALVNLNILSATGPVRVVRFPSDGAVHALFTTTDAIDAPKGCNLAQPDFAGHAATGDIAYRIPTPLFGAGLIEAIPDAAIASNERASKPFGIGGHANRNPNDGTITRFGWKAQNKSLALFAGEAFNVEQGITNDLFPDERGENGVPDPAECSIVPAGQDHTNYEGQVTQFIPSDVTATANFMRFLAAPIQASAGYITLDRISVSPASIANGQKIFEAVGCAVCHMPVMRTGNYSIEALSRKSAALFSDLLVHNMGALGDGVRQGNAGPAEIRTAPLWGVGQRWYLLHDGRTNDMLVAIEAHAAGGADADSEACTVINNFNGLSSADKQDVLNFLRSL